MAMTARPIQLEPREPRVLRTNRTTEELLAFSRAAVSVLRTLIVFHLDKHREAVVAHSVVRGPAWEDQVVWGARGARARGHNVMISRAGELHHDRDARP
jgi:hypothetical protein